jgi:hypothetical protein
MISVLNVTTFLFTLPLALVFQMNPMEAATKKQQERETLRNVIAQWNANRLDLFELSEPNEVSLEELYEGVSKSFRTESITKSTSKTNIR